MATEHNIKRLFVIMSISTLIVFLVYSFFFLHIRAKNRTLSVFINEVDLILQKETRLRSIQTLIKDIKLDMVQLDTYFVRQDAVDFIETIEELAAFSGTELEITSVSIDDIKDTESTVGELLRLNLEAAGVWQDIFHLLTLIESLPFKVTVTQANLEHVFTRQQEDEETPLSSWKGSFGVTAVKLK